MRSMRNRLCLIAAAMTLAVGAGAGTLPAVAATTVTSAVPLTIWDTPSPMQFDGLSTWLATFADPTAGTGQFTPEYTYFHQFKFGDGTGGDFGHVSLDVINGTKWATLVIVDTVEQREHRVRVLFPWTGNSFYFLWVNKLGPGLWGAWAYNATGPATFIGAVSVPTRLAKLSSESATGVAWIGPDLETCAAYPEAVMTRRAPTGYIGSTSVQTHLATRTMDPGDCPSTVAPFTTDWDYYVVGSPAPAPAPPVAAASSFQSPSGGTTGAERSYFPRP